MGCQTGKKCPMGWDGVGWDGVGWDGMGLSHPIRSPGLHRKNLKMVMELGFPTLYR